MFEDNWLNVKLNNESKISSGWEKVPVDIALPRVPKSENINTTQKYKIYLIQNVKHRNIEL